MLQQHLSISYKLLHKWWRTERLIIQLLICGLYTPAWCRTCPSRTHPWSYLLSLHFNILKWCTVIDFLGHGKRIWLQPERHYSGWEKKSTKTRNRSAQTNKIWRFFWDANCSFSSEMIFWFYDLFEKDPPVEYFNTYIMKKWSRLDRTIYSCTIMIF